MIARLLRRAELEERYGRALQRLEMGVPFWEAARTELGLRFRIDGEERLAQVPREGPVLLIANHPFGVVDGLVSCEVMSGLRERFQVLVNAVLCNEPLLDPWFLPIDFRDSREAARNNVRSRQGALNLLREGGGVILYPGGGVATRRYGIGPVEELPWGNFVAKLLLQAKPHVVPIFFEGTNSLLFHLVSQCSTSLRLGLFVRETLRLENREISCTIREILVPKDYSHLSSREELVRFLYRCTLDCKRSTNPTI
ncbi:1-acyl-sn-glycerol-3-phosphate acyltransferase [bacterium]|nr:1-acyl-sn-glycerol-3-phosphate acyltransferase [bacterium]